MIRRAGTLPLLAAGLVAALGWAHSVRAETVPVETGEKARLTAGITPLDDVDVFGFELFPGDRLTAKVQDTGPARGLLSTLRVLGPSGNDVGATVKKQGTRRPSVTYTAQEAGAYVVEVTGGDDPFDGAEGNFILTSSIKRGKQGKSSFADVAGGNFSVTVGVPTDALLDVKVKASKGGFDIDGLYRPDGSAEPAFSDSLKLKARKSAQAKKFAVSGGFGTYELRGAYDAGSKVKVAFKVRRSTALRKKRLSDAEPRVDPFIAPFPSRGIPGTVLTVAGFNFASSGSGAGAKVLPRFWVGGIEVPNETIEHPFGQSFKFPVPEGLVAGASYDLEMRNPDGQGDVYRDAFFVVAPPSALALDVDEAGPAGGRQIRILGNNLRGVSVVLFDGRIVQPSLVLDNRVDVVAPPHAPGEVTVVVRDEHFQSSETPQKLTYLDIGSNAITSVDPASLQGVGGETVTVTGVDFGLDSVLTLNGRDVSATRVSDTTLTFVAPPHVGGTFDLMVVDQYQQSDVESMEIRAFTNGTDSVIPAPVTVAGQVDSWRSTKILSGDVTGDGVTDVVLLRPSAAFGDDAQRSRIRILAGDGNGAYTDATSGIPAVTQADDWRARDGVLALVNNDNFLDIVIITTDELDGGTRSGLRVLLNDGDGNFTDTTDDAAPPATTWGDRNQGSAIVAVDVDNDLDIDLVITHTESFQETVDVSPPPMGPLPDPPPDPILETRYYAGTRVLVNDGAGNFSRNDTALPAVDVNTTQRFEGATVVATDVDGDDYADLFVTGETPAEDPDNEGSFLRRGILLLNDRSGNFNDVSASRLPDPSSPDYLQGDTAQFVDYDNDGDRDLVIIANTRLVAPGTGAVSTSSALRIYPVDDDGNFGRVAAGTLPAFDDKDSLQCETASFGDLTGDGRSDIFIASSRAPNEGERAGRVLIWTVNKFERGSEGLPHPAIVDDGRATASLMLDVDGDGDLELLIGRDEASATERHTRVFVNPRIE